jgi:hypothetical protein
VRKETILIILVSILSVPVSLVAQDNKNAIPLEKFYVDRNKHPLRALLKNFRFGFSTGFGSTYFKHTLDGFGIYQSPTEGPYIFKQNGNTIPIAGHAQWIDTNIPITPINYNAGTDFLVMSDTADIGFKSKSFTIPIKITLHYEFKNFRIGVGFAKDFIFMKPFTSLSYSDQIRNVEAEAGSVSTTKWFGMLGYSFYRIDKFLFTGDVQIGSNKFSKSFDRAVIDPSMHYNFGVTIERELSEYLKIFLRPNFEFKSYTMTLPESSPLVIKHKANALMWNIGVSYAIPELPKCKIKDCRIQMHHAHGNKEYRSRAHPIWKKQNPGYGENDPKLIKYKWRNRKKINTY